MASLRTTYGVHLSPWAWCARCLSAALLLCCGLVLGCSSIDDAEVSDDRVTDVANQDVLRARYGNLDNAGLDVVTFDLNTDGRADQIHYLQSGELSRIERDLNFDGVTDMYEYYASGELVEEELDLDLDGTVDVVVRIVDGRVESKRFAMGFRADMAIAQWYDSKGRLRRVERDTDGDGAVDLWEHFKPGETKPFRQELDTDGDGKPDKTLRTKDDG